MYEAYGEYSVHGKYSVKVKVQYFIYNTCSKIFSTLKCCLTSSNPLSKIKTIF